MSDGHNIFSPMSEKKYAHFVSAVPSTSSAAVQSPISLQPIGRPYGVLPPISRSPPSEADSRNTGRLMRTVKRLDPQESDEEYEKRLEVLYELNTVVWEWIAETSNRNGMSVEEARCVGGQIVTFGSFRLGVYSRGADVDALCLAPRNIRREEFFSSFVEKLRARPDVTGIRAIEAAYVPVLKMCFGGIDIDLLFARLAFKTIPKVLNLADDAVLKNLSEECVRSVNGFRVTEAIWKLVPNLKNFMEALRVVRLWAKRCGVYSNILGFLGGVSWAILVARICLLYPEAVPATIVYNFFRIYSEWEWPKPVLLNEVEPPPGGNLRGWDPQTYPADGHHLMPIVSPCYPRTNTAYNVTSSNLKVLRRAFEDGRKRISEATLSRMKKGNLFEWHQNFFEKYKHFLLVIASAPSEEDHKMWRGFVESRLRKLVRLLDHNDRVLLAHVNTGTFKLVETSKNLTEDALPYTVWVIGIDFEQGTTKSTVDLKQEGLQFHTEVMDTAVEINLYKDGMNLEIKYVKEKHLKDYLGTEVITRGRRPLYLDIARAPASSSSSLSMVRKGLEERTSTASGAVSSASSDSGHSSSDADEFQDDITDVDELGTDSESEGNKEEDAIPSIRKMSHEGIAILATELRQKYLALVKSGGISRAARRTGGHQSSSDAAVKRGDPGTLGQRRHRMSADPLAKQEGASTSGEKRSFDSLAENQSDRDAPVEPVADMKSMDETWPDEPRSASLPKKKKKRKRDKDISSHKKRKRKISSDAVAEHEEPGTSRRKRHKRKREASSDAVAEHEDPGTSRQKRHKRKRGEVSSDAVVKHKNTVLLHDPNAPVEPQTVRESERNKDEDVIPSADKMSSDPVVQQADVSVSSEDRMSKTKLQPTPEGEKGKGKGVRTSTRSATPLVQHEGATTSRGERRSGCLAEAENNEDRAKRKRKLSSDDAVMKHEGSGPSSDANKANVPQTVAESGSQTSEDAPSTTRKRFKRAAEPVVEPEGACTSAGKRKFDSLDESDSDDEDEDATTHAKKKYKISADAVEEHEDTDDSLGDPDVADEPETVAESGSNESYQDSDFDFEYLW